MTKTIAILGLGAGDIEQLPVGVYKKLTQAEHVYLRTREHPVIQELEQEGIQYQSFDFIYEKHENFESVYEEICSTLLRFAESHDIVYAVPGHPLVAEKTVQLLLNRGPEQGVEIEIGGGQSFLDALFQTLHVDPIEGFQLLDGTSLTRDDLQIKQHMVIAQVYDEFVASDVKLTLMEKLPDDYEVVIVTAAGGKNQKLKKVPLYKLDRETELNNLTSVYVPAVSNEQILFKEFTRLRQIIAELRGPYGCPWDKKQTHHSLKKYLIEEAYELIEAINHDDLDHMVEELGDVLLQVMLHAQIGEDTGFFTIDDVIGAISEKMVRRHPHVFNGVDVQDEQEVLKNWEQIKKEEKGESDSSLLAGVSKGQPGLLRAYELQKAASKVGFDWKEVGPAWEKVKEEIDELEEEIVKNINRGNVIKEFGDLLFALVNVGRFYNIHPEEAIIAANEKFVNRFSFIEKKVKESGKVFNEHTLTDLDQFWEEAKKLGL